MTTLSLAASKEIYELVRGYETEKKFCPENSSKIAYKLIPSRGVLLPGDIPAPTFSELMFILPRIAEKRTLEGESVDYSVRFYAEDMCYRYTHNSTEPEAMQTCEEYLTRLLG